MYTEICYYQGQPLIASRSQSNYINAHDEIALKQIQDMHSTQNQKKLIMSRTCLMEEMAEVRVQAF